MSPAERTTMLPPLSGREEEVFRAIVAAAGVACVCDGGEEAEPSSVTEPCAPPVMSVLPPESDASGERAEVELPIPPAPPRAMSGRVVDVMW